MNKAFAVLFAAIAGFWLYTNPHGFATFLDTAGSGLWSFTEQFFAAVIDVVGQLTSS